MPSPMFTGTVAVVTGAGSGIGAALATALVARGAHVVLADRDLRSAEAVATAATAAGPGSARAAQLDVVDATAVKALVTDVVRREGRLDLMVNNAGIMLAGETEALSATRWGRVVDVNVRGVVNGVAAAYPVMVEQGDGHIVNTASLAGLVPAGLLTSVSMASHAVVGLSLSLRAEAAAKGVRVTVLCPSAVETPLLDTGSVGGFDGRRHLTSDQGIRVPLDAAEFAAQALVAVARNRRMLVTPRSARIAWRVSRLSPRIGDSFARSVVRTQRKRAESS